MVVGAGASFGVMSIGLMVKSLSTGYGNYPEISLVNARKIHEVARQLVEMGKHPSTLLDIPDAKQMIIDGCSVKEIESHSSRHQRSRSNAGINDFWRCR